MTSPVRLGSSPRLRVPQHSTSRVRHAMGTTVSDFLAKRSALGDRADSSGDAAADDVMRLIERRSALSAADPAAAPASSADADPSASIARLLARRAPTKD